MKALVFHGPGKKSWDDVPDPQILKPTDAIVKIDTTTICGTDLHILKGDVPAVTEGRILGHEGVGHVVEVGEAVGNVKVGDRVVVSCVSACGRCIYCRQGVYSHCLDEEGASGIGWILGHLIDGTQAEYVRAPFADNSLYVLPDDVPDEQGMLLSDIFPTGQEIGVQYGEVKAGDVVASAGAGPVGLAAMMTSRLHGPSKVIAIDLDANRVEEAKKFGATHGVVASDPDWKDQVMALTDGLGVDVAMEAAGIPATLQMCFNIVRPAGHVANLGVHGKAVELPMDQLWISNSKMSMGLVNANTTDTLLKMVASKQLDGSPFVSHRFKLADIMEAYEVFGNAAETKALKIALTA